TYESYRSHDWSLQSQRLFLYLDLMSDLPHEPSALPEQLREWLRRAVDAGASDLHLIVGYPPVLRLHGDLVELPEPPLQEAETHPLLCSLCPPEVLARLHAHKDADFSFALATN